MGLERTIAGLFAGTGSLLGIYLGTTIPNESLLTASLVILSSMVAFFVGEKNGQQKVTSES